MVRFDVVENFGFGFLFVLFIYFVSGGEQSESDHKAFWLGREGDELFFSGSECYGAVFHMVGFVWASESTRYI